MNIEQERAAFEAACRKHAEESGYDGHERLERNGDGYADPHTQAAWWGWREGRAALQSQDREDNREWMRRFIELLDEFGDESARYAHPCETDRSWLDKIRADIIDHARRIEGDNDAAI